MKKVMGAIILSVLVLVVPSVMVACAPAEEASTPAVPVEEKVVKIGLITDLSGPTSPTISPIAEGLFDRMNYINEKGIEYQDPKTGKTEKVRIEILIGDTRGEKPAAISLYKRHREAGIVVAFNMESTTGLALWGLTIEDKIPSLNFGGAFDIIDPRGWTYGGTPTQNQQFGLFLQWAVKNWKEPRPMRLAILYHDIPWSMAVIQPQALDYAKKLGVDVVWKGAVSVFPLDTTPQLTAISEAKADWVYMTVIQPPAAVVMKDADRIGVKLGFATGTGTYSEEIITLAGELAEGYIGMVGLAMPVEEDTIPEIKVSRQLLEKNHPGKVLTVNSVTGHFGAVLVTHIVSVALEKFGYPLTGSQVREAITTIKHYDCEGLQPGLVSWGPGDTWDDHCAIEQSRLGIVKEGKMIPLTDWTPVPMEIMAELK